MILNICLTDIARLPELLSLVQRESKEEGINLNFETVKITLDAQNCLNKIRREFEEKMADDLHTSYVLNAILPEALKVAYILLSLCLKLST